MNNPHFKHEDCSACKFVGSYEGSNGVADLYYHDGEIDITVMARFSDDPSDYREGIESAIKKNPNEYLAEAWKRAIKQKLVRKEVKAYYELYRQKSFVRGAAFKLATEQSDSAADDLYNMSDYLELSDAIDNALSVLYNHMYSRDKK